jgi:hypothetical protein
LRDRLQGLAINVPETPNWIEKTPRFWYRKSVKGGNEFVLADAQAATKQAAFDHARLAAALSAAANEKYEPLKLPFQSITFVDNERALTFAIAGSRWRCELADYTCKKTGEAPRGFGFGQRGPDNDESPRESGNDVTDGMAATASQQGPPAATQSTAPTSNISPDGQ